MHKSQTIEAIQEKNSHSSLFFVDHHCSPVLITGFTSMFADSIDDDSTFVDRGPSGSGSFAVLLDALK